MIRKFSLYGFLKNQRYYEPFIILAFLEMGLSYTLIGVIIAFREVMVNIMEIPTGALADLYSKRRSMIVSFLSYMLSFILIGTIGLISRGGSLSTAAITLLILVAMVFYAVGEAFRTGTHKAMIFTWLRLQGRIDERTRVYGYTRSWSKIGSAVNAVIAALIVFFTRSFIPIFFVSLIPYLLNIINLSSYPKELDGTSGGKISFKDTLGHLTKSLALPFRNRRLGRIILESMGFEGFFMATKDFLQPILLTAALALLATLFTGPTLDNSQQAAILVGPVYLVLFLLSAVASRNSHLFVRKPGLESRTARYLWAAMLLTFAIMLPAAFYAQTWLVIICYVFLYVVQNVWRPVLISRIDDQSSEAMGATVLSIESQAKSLGAMILAPLAGYLIDSAVKHKIGAGEFWPVPLLGMLIALIFLITGRKKVEP